MRAQGVESLVSSLLYEGYALYPYTPGATKNATPTPFGIVYPPAYAETQPAAHSHARLECVLRPGHEATLTATVRFLQAAGERHQGLERRLELDPVGLEELLSAEAGPLREFSFDPEERGGPVISGRVRIRAERVGADLARVKLCVHNSTGIDVSPEPTRAEALRHSLLSVHPLLEADGGSFVSPLERDGALGAAVSGCDPLNTFPVLVGDGDRAVLGAAIALPEHPELAPESLGNLFDNTEIEEALLLHVQALSEGEREAISGQDPAVREMIERADSVSNDEMLDLHGRLTFTEPEQDSEPIERPESNAHRQPPPGIGEIQGEARTEIAGAAVRRGDKVVLRPGTERDVFDKILNGRRATIERIYRGYDDRVYLGVTVDDDPGQDLLRETGRYLFFFGDEVEVEAIGEAS